MKIALSLIVLLLLSIPTSAQKDSGWRYLGENAYFAYSYNPKRISRPSINIVKLWIQTYLREGVTADKIVEDFKKRGLTAPEYKNFARAVRLYECNCKIDQMRTIRIITYDSKNDVIDDLKTDQAEWEDIVPDSIAEIIFNTACSDKSKN